MWLCYRFPLSLRTADTLGISGERTRSTYAKV
jgi:hypothetical protein